MESPPVKKTSYVGVAVAFACAGLCRLAFIGSSLMQYFLLRHPHISPAEAQWNDLRYLFITRFSVPVGLTATIIYFVWLYKAKKAAIGLGMKDEEYSPGLSVGCFFIPFANLGMPYLAVQELWRGSLHPTEWEKQPGATLVGWWWAAWLVNGLGSWAVAIYAHVGAHDVEALRTVTLLFAAMAVVSLICYALTVVLARKVTAQINDRVVEATEPPVLAAS